MIRKSISARVALALLAVAAGACSSSSGGTAAQPPGWPSTYLFYTDGAGGLGAVDPVTLATIAVEPAIVSTVTVPALVSVGTWNVTSSLLENVHTHAIVYRKRDAATGDDQLWAASAALGAAPASRRVTTFSAPAAQICAGAVFPDNAAPDSSVVMGQDGGLDASCATTVDNALFLVRLSDAATDHPRTYGVAGSALVAPIPSAQGGIAGWLVRRGTGGVWVEPADWATAGTIRLTSSDAVSLLAVYPGKVWLSVDGNLKVYAAGATALSDPGNVGATYPVHPISASDGRTLYFVAAEIGAVIQRVRLDGSGPVELVCSLGTDGANELALSDDHVAYRSHTTGAWKAFPKAGGPAVTLYTPPSSGDTVSVHVAGRSFYFYDSTRYGSALVDPSGATTSHGGTGTDTNPGSGTYSYWAPVAGSTVRFGTAPFQNPGRMLRIDADKTAEVTTLRVFDAATATQLGGAVTFPPEYAASSAPAPAVFAEGSGSSQVALIAATIPTGTGLFALDAAGAPVLRKVSASSYATGSPVGTSFSCSTGGGLAAAPAVVALLALRLLRRRHRP